MVTPCPSLWYTHLHRSFEWCFAHDSVPHKSVPHKSAPPPHPLNRHACACSTHVLVMSTACSLSFPMFITSLFPSASSRLKHSRQWPIFDCVSKLFSHCRPAFAQSKPQAHPIVHCSFPALAHPPALAMHSRQWLLFDSASKPFSQSLPAFEKSKLGIYTLLPSQCLRRSRAPPPSHCPHSQFSHGPAGLGVHLPAAQGVTTGACRAE